MVPAVSATFVGSGTGGSGAAYLTFLGSIAWVPALVRTTYTAGFPGGLVPRVLNEIVGINAALEILALLAATNKAASYSLSADGLSQSVSGPGPQVYEARMKYLMEKKNTIIRKIKSIYGLNVQSSYV